MASYLLHHGHEPRECGVVFAAFKGPGRAQQTLDHTEVTRVEGNRRPAAIAHGVHNASWGALAALTVTSSPVLVNEYLAGDTGVFILITTIVAAFWLRRWLRHHPREES